MEKKIRKLLSLTALVTLSTPAMADWPVAVADKFTLHQNYSLTELDLLKNDIGSNLKVVEVNEWSEKGGRLSLRDVVRTSRDQLHNYGDVSYAPKDDFVGQDAFWYVVEDDQGRKNAVRSIVNVKPSSLALPAPRQDFIDVPKDTPVRIDALENDLFSNQSTISGDWTFTFRGNIADFTRTTEQGGKVEKVEVYPKRFLSFGPVRNGGYRLENTLRYQFKYTPPAGFVGTDSFNYAIKDSIDQSGREINDTVKWTKVTLNVSDSKTISAAWPTAAPDEANVFDTPGMSLSSLGGFEIDVLKNDSGEDLILKLSSNYSQKGSKVEVVPNYPNRPVIRYTTKYIPEELIGTSLTDKVWYVVEDTYGRRSFSYIDINVDIR